MLSALLIRKQVSLFGHSSDVLRIPERIGSALDTLGASAILWENPKDHQSCNNINNNTTTIEKDSECVIRWDACVVVVGYVDVLNDYRIHDGLASV